MTDAPVVSCIVTTHNFAPFLARSLDSVLTQDYPQERIQIVVVDDGSTDETPSVMEPYLGRVEYIRKPNGGLRSTINRGLEEARGDMITFQSGDDVWLPGRLRSQVAEMLARPTLGLLYGDMRVIDADDRTLADSFWATERIVPLSGRPVAALMRGNFVSGGTMIVRAALRPHFDPMPEFAPWEDWWIALRVAQVAEIDYLDRPMIGYRRHGGNMNLGADAARAIGIGAAELPLRRWLLTDFESDLLNGSDWLAALREWESALVSVARGLGTEIASLVSVSDGDRRRALDAVRATGEHLAANERLAAVRENVRALGYDPFGPEPRNAQAAVADVSTPGSGDFAGLEARAFVTLADAEELIVYPGLLAAYGGAFRGCDDASLVVVIAEDRIDAFSDLVTELGLAGEDGPDLVGVPVSPGSRVPLALARVAHAVLGRRRSGDASVKPHADERTVHDLRALAQRRWSGGG